MYVRCKDRQKAKIFRVPQVGCDKKSKSSEKHLGGKENVSHARFLGRTFSVLNDKFQLYF